MRISSGSGGRLFKAKDCFVGVTGSAGKTAVKDLSANILRRAGDCFSTPSSLNYPDGIARLMFKVSPQHKFCVLEVSGGNPGELDRPLRLFTPKIAVLTLIARDHLKAFKSLEAIAREKGKLVSALPADGVAVLNIDDPLVRSIGESCNRRVIWVGEAEGATSRLLSARSRWPEPLILGVEYEGKIFEVKTGLYGKHLALSVLSALGVGLAAGIPLTNAISAVAEVRPPDDAKTAKASVLRSFSSADETALEPGVDRAVDILLREMTALVPADQATN